MNDKAWKLKGSEHAELGINWIWTWTPLYSTNTLASLQFASTAQRTLADLFSRPSYIPIFHDHPRLLPSSRFSMLPVISATTLLKLTSFKQSTHVLSLP